MFSQFFRLFFFFFLHNSRLASQGAAASREPRRKEPPARAKKPTWRPVEPAADDSRPAEAAAPDPAPDPAPPAPQCVPPPPTAWWTHLGIGGLCGGILTSQRFVSPAGWAGAMGQAGRRGLGWAVQQNAPPPVAEGTAGLKNGHFQERIGVVGMGAQQRPPLSPAAKMRQKNV